MKRDLRIAELQFAVEFALQSAKYTGQTSARVQSVPDTRAIRYYTTLGILDRPAEMKGRTAFYDRRHVLQLVAIKRLQAQGKSLGDIQTELTGLSNRKLSSIAKLAAGFWGSLEKQLSKNPVKAKPKASKAPKTREFVLERSDALGSSERSPRKARMSSSREFWKTPAAIDAERPSVVSSVEIEIACETRIKFPNGVSISVPVSPKEVTDEFIETILPEVEKLASEIEMTLQQQKTT
jgi:DNA-binding transcriptional MerR regulator